MWIPPGDGAPRAAHLCSSIGLLSRQKLLTGKDLEKRESPRSAHSQLDEQHQKTLWRFHHKHHSHGSQRSQSMKRSQNSVVYLWACSCVTDQMVVGVGNPESWNGPARHCGRWRKHSSPKPYPLKSPQQQFPQKSKGLTTTQLLVQ